MSSDESACFAFAPAFAIDVVYDQEEINPNARFEKPLYRCPYNKGGLGYIHDSKFSQSNKVNVCHDIYAIVDKLKIESFMGDDGEALEEYIEDACIRIFPIMDEQMDQQPKIEMKQSFYANVEDNILDYDVFNVDIQVDKHVCEENDVIQQFLLFIEDEDAISNNQLFRKMSLRPQMFKKISIVFRKVKKMFQHVKIGIVADLSEASNIGNHFQKRPFEQRILCNSFTRTSAERCKCKRWVVLSNS